MARDSKVDIATAVLRIDQNAAGGAARGIDLGHHTTPPSEVLTRVNSGTARLINRLDAGRGQIERVIRIESTYNDSRTHSSADVRYV